MIQATLGLRPPGRRQRRKGLSLAQGCATLLLTACVALAEPPAAPPPVGLTVVMVFDRARDADTIEAHVAGSAYRFAFRLIETWAPELHADKATDRDIAAAGREYVTDRCRGRQLTVFIPLEALGDEPLQALTFDRIPAWVWVSPAKTLNREVVEHGFASTTKRGVLGK